MLEVGSLVMDRRVGARATIRHVVPVPSTRDLFGSPVAAHRRFVVEYEDGRWANDRVEGDFDGGAEPTEGERAVQRELFLVGT